MADDDVGEVETLILEADEEAFLGGEPEASDAAEGEDGEEAEEEGGFLFLEGGKAELALGFEGADFGHPKAGSGEEFFLAGEGVV